MLKNLEKSIAAVLPGLLAACGGSSDDASTAKPQLVATAGDATVYRGKWRSDCGSVLVGTTLQGVKFEFNVTGAAGNVASGSLTTMTYSSEPSCTDGVPPLSTSTAAVTLTIDSVAATVDGDYTGQADKVTVASPGTTSTIAYFGFTSGKDRFYVSATPSFSILRPAYTKSGS